MCYQATAEEVSMAITVNSSSVNPNVSNNNVNVKAAQLAREQQKVEGEIAVQLIEAAEPAQSSGPVGNVGHNIDTTA
jgi:hypothetical protein